MMNECVPDGTSGALETEVDAGGRIRIGIVESIVNRCSMSVRVPVVGTHSSST